MAVLIIFTADYFCNGILPSVNVAFFAWLRCIGPKILFCMSVFHVGLLLMQLMNKRYLPLVERRQEQADSMIESVEVSTAY